MSSKRAERRRSCTGKVQYRSAAEAIDTARARARVENKPTSRPLNAYACKFCGGWHLGHPPGRVRQAIAAARNERRRTA